MVSFIPILTQKPARSIKPQSQYRDKSMELAKTALRHRSQVQTNTTFFYDSRQNFPPPHTILTRVSTLKLGKMPKTINKALPKDPPFVLN